MVSEDSQEGPKRRNDTHDLMRLIIGFCGVPFQAMVNHTPTRQHAIYAPAYSLSEISLGKRAFISLDE